MKKKLILPFLLLSLTLLGACQNKQTLTTSKTSETKARETSQTIKEEQKIQNEHLASLEVDLSQAVALYQAEFPQTEIKTIQLEEERGTYFYEIQGLDQAAEYEVKINGQTGAVKAERPDKRDGDDQEEQEQVLDLTSRYLSLEEATEIAEKEVSQSLATEWLLEKDLGVMYWEIKVKAGFESHEIKINALDGSVIEHEQND